MKSARLACQTIDKTYSWLTSGISYLGDNLSNRYGVRGSNEAIGLSNIMNLMRLEIRTRDVQYQSFCSVPWSLV